MGSNHSTGPAPGASAASSSFHTIADLAKRWKLSYRQILRLIEGRVASRNFGEPISLAGPPRTIELGFRYSY